MSPSPNGVKKITKSYKGHLTGIIPNAYEKAFFNENTEAKMEELNQNRNLQENEAFFSLLEKLKSRIYEPWKFTLIGKVFGKKS